MKMPGGGILKVGPGQVTDDSEMALSLAHALIRHEASQLQGAAAELYVKWLNSKPFDVGNQSAPLDSTHTGQQSVTWQATCQDQAYYALQALPQEMHFLLVCMLSRKERASLASPLPWWLLLLRYVTNSHKTAATA